MDANRDAAAGGVGADIHVPVLVDRVVALLSPALRRPDAICVDVTVGMAGHAHAILAANPGMRLIGIDRDRAALDIARARLGAAFAGRCHLVQARFDEITEVLGEFGIAEVQAVLADLGLSSLQIDQTERGFAYATDAALDMRMDVRSERTAAQIVNHYSAADLERVLSRFGEEPHARRIARAIVAARAHAPFTSSARLVEVIGSALPAAVRHGGGHPAKRTFQALRIEVNGELEALSGLLPAALDHLAVGGRFAVLAYHSLEDRMVKRSFAAACADAAPPRLPVVPPQLLARFAPLTRGAEKPDAGEVARNPRAASARLRAVERIRPADHPRKEHR